MNRFWVILMLPWLALGTETPRPFYSAYSSYYEALHRRRLSDRAEFRELRDWIAERGIASVDDLLKAFAAEPRYRPYLSYYVLMYASQSRQRAAVSPDFPRVILHHPESRLVLALTGDPKFPDHFRQLEVAELEKDDRAFAFHLVDFGAPKERRFTEPESCRRCHGRSPRPIWGTYRLWTGAYGGFDDKIVAPVEQAHWDRFARTQMKRGRYAKLLPPGPRAGSRAELGPRVNDMLNDVLGDLNSRRLVALWRSSQGWRRYRWALTAILRECRGIDAFLPASPDRETKISALRVELARAAEAEFAARTARYATLNGYASVDALDSVYATTDKGIRQNFDAVYFAAYQNAELQYLADLAGWAFADWSISFNPERPKDFAFQAHDIGAWDNLDRYYLTPVLEASSDAEDRVLATATCETLRARSRAALGIVP